MWQICEKPNSEPVHFMLYTDINFSMCKLIVLHTLWVTLQHCVCSKLKNYIFEHLCMHLYCAALLNNWHLWKEMAEVPRLFASLLSVIIWALRN